MGFKVRNDWLASTRAVVVTVRHTLVTPDPGVYAGAVKELIASATRTLYMQFQYIEPPKAGVTTAQPFTDLINAVIDRQQHGVEVKIIMSESETAGYLEQLQAMGLDVVSNVRIQKNVHNKGIVVDGATVLVSSQNWSADGTLRNRDAGVIIYHQDAAPVLPAGLPARLGAPGRGQGGLGLTPGPGGVPRVPAVTELTGKAAAIADLNPRETRSSIRDDGGRCGGRPV